MRRAGGGSIINTSSIVGLLRSGDAAAYRSTNGAVRLLAKTAAVEFASIPIRVNSVHPGVIDTAMVSDHVPVAVAEQLLAMTPMGRMGKPEQIAAGVCSFFGRRLVHHGFRAGDRRRLHRAVRRRRYRREL
jgi:NAD(P)-dependent dehydrogenase (short-subunit alcohol dehydrogenase family)